MRILSVDEEFWIFGSMSPNRFGIRSSASFSILFPRKNSKREYFTGSVSWYFCWLRNEISFENEVFLCFSKKFNSLIKKVIGAFD